MTVPATNTQRSLIMGLQLSTFFIHKHGKQTPVVSTSGIFKH